MMSVWFFNFGNFSIFFPVLSILFCFSIFKVIRTGHRFGEVLFLIIVVKGDVYFFMDVIVLFSKLCFHAKMKICIKYLKSRYMGK